MILGTVHSQVGDEIVVSISGELNNVLFSAKDPTSITDSDMPHQFIGKAVSFEEGRKSEGKVLDLIGPVAAPYAVVKLSAGRYNPGKSMRGKTLYTEGGQDGRKKIKWQKQRRRR